MKVRFLDIAEVELDDAIRWYQVQAPGLGEAFLVEVLTAADRITRYPAAWQELGHGIVWLLRTLAPTVNHCRLCATGAGD